MQIRHDALIHFPLHRVYDAFLTGMERLPPWLPGIDRIDVTRFEQLSAHTAEVDYKWHVDRSIVPDALQAITAIAESTGDARGIHLPDGRARQEARHG